MRMEASRNIPEEKERNSKNFQGPQETGIRTMGKTLIFRKTLTPKQWEGSLAENLN